MADPFDSIVAFCNYSSSQEDLLERSLFAREDGASRESDSPEPCNSSRSPAAAAVADGNGIVICSAPETPVSKAAASPSTDEFKTPPEESRRSSSEEPPPPPVQSSRREEPDALGVDGGHETAGVETGRGVGTADLGFLQEGKKSKMVELRSDGKVCVEEVCEIDVESITVVEKRKARESPIEESTPSKKIRVSGEDFRSAATPILETEEPRSNSPSPGNLPTAERSKSDIEGGNEGGNPLAKRKLDFPSEIQAELNGETGECQRDDTVEIEVDNEEEGNRADGEEISSAPQDEERMNDDIVDRDRRGRRELPSWMFHREDDDEEHPSHVSVQRTGNEEMKKLLDVLGLLAREVRRCHENDKVDLIETAKRRGMVFPEPSWWHDDDSDEDDDDY